MTMVNRLTISLMDEPQFIMDVKAIWARATRDVLCKYDSFHASTLQAWTDITVRTNTSVHIDPVACFFNATKLASKPEIRCARRWHNETL